MIRVKLDTAGHRRQQDRWLGGSDNGRLGKLLRVMRGLDRYSEFCCTSRHPFVVDVRQQGEGAMCETWVLAIGLACT